MQKLTIQTTKHKEVVDITERIDESIHRHRIKSGVCVVAVLHTTCCLTTADLDPGTDEDFLEAIEKMFPKGNYRHPHDPNHVGEHIMSSFIGTSVILPIENGKLLLGTWQRVVLIELSGPRERNLVVKFI